MSPPQFDDGLDRSDERPDPLVGLIDGPTEPYRTARDPVTEALAGSTDLYGISEWDERTLSDRLSVRLYELLLRRPRLTVSVLGAALLATWSLPIILSTLSTPTTTVYTLLSIGIVLPVAVVTMLCCGGLDHPIRLYLVTFCLSGFLGGAAAFVNSSFESLLLAVPLVGMLLFYLCVVGPIEEAVKLLSVRLVAYRDSSFDRVIDGVVFGAVAGVGFATIENAAYVLLYVSQFGFDIVLSRLAAAPGHVIWSALAGYYLGLARFNPAQAGPIMLKGLLFAAAAHGLYNVAVTLLADSSLVSFGFVFGYQLVLFAVLVRMIRRYRIAAQHAALVEPPVDAKPEPTVVRTLAQIQALYDVGLLTAEEFELKRRELLERL